MLIVFCLFPFIQAAWILWPQYHPWVLLTLNQHSKLLCSQTIDFMPFLYSRVHKWILGVIRQTAAVPNKLWTNPPLFSHHIAVDSLAVGRHHDPQQTFPPPGIITQEINQLLLKSLLPQSTQIIASHHRQLDSQLSFSKRRVLLCHSLPPRLSSIKRQHSQAHQVSITARGVIKLVRFEDYLIKSHARAYYRHHIGHYEWKAAQGA